MARPATKKINYTNALSTIKNEFEFSKEIGTLEEIMQKYNLSRTRAIQLISQLRTEGYLNYKLRSSYHYISSES